MLKLNLEIENNGAEYHVERSFDYTARSFSHSTGEFLRKNMSEVLAEIVILQNKVEALNRAEILYVIVGENEYDDVTNERLFWSNNEGWTIHPLADSFNADERDYINLPIGGKWVELEDSYSLL